jgi:hypothetical protein
MEFYSTKTARCLLAVLAFSCVRVHGLFLILEHPA